MSRWTGFTDACVLEENMGVGGEVHAPKPLPANDSGALCWHCSNTDFQGDTNGQ